MFDITAMLTWAALLTGSPGGPVPADRPALLSHLRHYGDRTVTRVERIGTGNGIRYSIRLDRTPDGAVVTMTLGPLRDVRLRLTEVNFARLDISDIREGVAVEDGTGILTFDLRYGDRTDCYVNDAGKSILQISLRANGELAASRASLANCEANWEELRLSRRSQGNFTVASQ